MPGDRSQSHGRRSLLWVAAIICLVAVPALQRSDTSVPMASAKLTTILADLSRSIPQDTGPAPQASGRAAAAFNPRSFPKSARDAVRGQQLRFNSKSEAQVYILMSGVTDKNLETLRANGVTVEIPDMAHRRVQASVPLSRLQAVSSLPFVNFVRLPTYAVKMTGSVDTEGDVIHHAEQARAQFVVDGSGVKVGVISDGIKGIFEQCPTPGAPCNVFGLTNNGPISTGDLPTATGSRNASGVLTTSSGGITASTFTGTNDLEGILPGCGFAGAGAEGTALLEIVHDIAPGADLSFANADTDIAFNQAVNKLAASNDVVVDDLAFIGLAADGTSDVSVNTANALNSSANPIRAYVTSAGNAADEHYFGTYTDSRVNGSTPQFANNGRLHLFQTSADTTDVLGLGPKPYNVIKLPAGGEVVIVLNWDDPFGGSSNNYDLYLVQESTGAIVDRSTDVQAGSGDPLEVIDYVNDTGAEGNFHIVIQNVGNAAAAKHLNLYSFEPECATAGPERLASPRHERENFNTATRSVPAQSDAGGAPVSVISVGAICSASANAQIVFSGSAAPDESCFDTTNSTIEFFSSQGPTLDGRIKPDISAIDGVSITGAGNFENPFFGTSAAAPHIAGIAALLLQSKVCLLSGVPGALEPADARANVRDLLLANANPLGVTPPNNQFGAGLADALASASASVPIFSGSSTLFLSGNSPLGASLASVDPSELGFSEPATCPMATFTVTGDCGTGPSSGLTCGFGTQNVTIKASNNNGLSYSPEVSLKLVVTNFSVAPASPASATVRAGLSATYTIFASAVGGAFNNPVTLTCLGLPAGSTCTFNPSAVTPGSTSVATSLAISTTGNALAPPLIGVPPETFNLHTAPWLAIFLALVLFAAAGAMGMRWAKLSGTRGWVPIYTLSLVLAFLLILPACGGGNTPPAPPVPTSPGTYQITITGTSGTLTQTATVTLVVQ